MIISSSAGLMSMVSSQNEFSDDLDEFITLILNKVTPRGQSEATGAAGLGDDAASRIVM